MAATPGYEHIGATVESEDSALGRWTVAHWSPSASSRLSGAVERIWYFDGVIVYPKERVFPDGIAELIVMLDEPHRNGDANALVPFPAVCINGLRTRSSVVVAPPGRCRVLGICFAPLGAGVLMRASMKDLLDVTIDLRHALGRAADELGERCSGAAATSAWNPERNAVAVLRAAAHWTERRIAGNGVADPMLSWSVRAIRDARGIVSVEAIRERSGLSRPRLAQRFRDGLGVTPKRFARMVRFHNALVLLAREKNVALAAAELAYYDQAHMYRDFEEFAGMTPGAFLSARRYPGSASLVES
ncbi:MAG TPA: helix-turn-helix domain-containing protein [Candidatus Cybelea sp.]|jgi:AraC-like DNA-binding protein|nr:helix-turn-helix domain-containing protein [Candidatus Cybelea sp.]